LALLQKLLRALYAPPYFSSVQSFCDLRHAESGGVNPASILRALSTPSNAVTPAPDYEGHQFLRPYLGFRTALGSRHRESTVLSESSCGTQSPNPLGPSIFVFRRAVFSPSAKRVRLRVNTSDSRGMLVTKGRISQPIPSGMSRVRETASIWIYTPPSRSQNRQ